MYNWFNNSRQIKLQKLERRQVLNFQKELSEGDISIRTCNNILKVLKIVLNDAVVDELITKSPADSVKALKETGAKATETYHRALTEQEQKDFMQEMKKDYYYEFVSLLLCTGMRIGEVSALTWGDIDYGQNVIHVTKTVTFNEGGTMTIGSPKSKAGYLYRYMAVLSTTMQSIMQSVRRWIGWKSRVKR